MRMLGMWMMAMAVGACGKTAEAPTEPSKVADPQALSAPAPAPEAKTAPEAKAPEAKAPEAKVAGEHEGGCAEHMAAAQNNDEANCPFADEGKEAGCEHGGNAEAKKVEGGTHFGGAFAIDQSKPLGAVLAGATDGQELTVRVSGQIDKVCQKMGCWMVVKDGDVEARVVMKDHAFTVPLDSKGKPAQVEGVLKVRVYSEAQAKHLAEDGGEDPSKVQGEKKELVLTATAVEIGG